MYNRPLIHRNSIVVVIPTFLKRPKTKSREPIYSQALCPNKAFIEVSCLNIIIQKGFYFCSAHDDAKDTLSPAGNNLLSVTDHYYYSDNDEDDFDTR